MNLQQQGSELMSRTSVSTKGHAEDQDLASNPYYISVREPCHTWASPPSYVPYNNQERGLCTLPEQNHRIGPEWGNLDLRAWEQEN